jgi:hypothetical protein
MPSLPAIADGALFSQDRIEQNETKDAVDVEENQKQDSAQQHNRADEPEVLAEAGGVNVWRKRERQEFIAHPAPLTVELAQVGNAAATGVQFGSQDAHEAKSRPLPEAKTREQLIARVLNGGLNAVDCRNGHKAPRLQRHPKTAWHTGQAGS